MSDFERMIRAHMEGDDELKALQNMYEQLMLGHHIGEHALLPNTVPDGEGLIATPRTWAKYEPAIDDAHIEAKRVLTTDVGAYIVEHLLDVIDNNETTIGMWNTDGMRIGDATLEGVDDDDESNIEVGVSGCVFRISITRVG